MLDDVCFGRNDVGSQGWDLLNPSHPLFPILFPKTTEKATRGGWSYVAMTKGALNELRSKIRRFLFSGIATSEVVDRIVEEVIMRMGTERPLRRLDSKRGNGGGLFHTFLKRRVAKEVRCLRRGVVTIALPDAGIPAKEEEFDGCTAENRELLQMVLAWLPAIPEKQAEAIRKWLDVENRHPGAREKLTPKERVNLTRGKKMLRLIARRKGMLE